MSSFASRMFTTADPRAGVASQGASATVAAPSQTTTAGLYVPQLLRPFSYILCILDWYRQATRDHPSELLWTEARPPPRRTCPSRPRSPTKELLVMPSKALVPRSRTQHQLLPVVKRSRLPLQPKSRRCTFYLNYLLFFLTCFVS
jgi:hypothetical protein